MNIAKLILTAAFIVIVGTSCERTGSAIPEIQHIKSDSETAISLATVADDVPLVFTNQIFPFDRNGNLIGEADLTIQVDQVLNNMVDILQTAGTDLTGLMRIHLYLSDEEYSGEVLRKLEQILPDAAQPAVTLISGNPARAGVMVSMDAVAVAPQNIVSGQIKYIRAKRIYGPKERSHAAVLPPGHKVFISGQSNNNERLLEAIRGTMHGLFATLAYSNATAADVVQVKAFINPVDDAEAVEKEIVGFFRGGQAPPIVSVEWLHENRPTEIELVASGSPDLRKDEASSYYAPPWMTQATTFSRVVDVHHGKLFFTSGLYGEAGQDGEAQARDIFKTLDRILAEAGSNYDHLVKATYYSSTDDGAQGLRDVRTEYYNPERPPAASLIKVAGTGRSGTTLNVDMIGVIPE